MRLLICDGFGTYETLKVTAWLTRSVFAAFRLTLPTSSNVAIFAPLKTAYREALERRERGGPRLQIGT